MGERHDPSARNRTAALSVTAPLRAALAPRGYYLLFIVDGRGVPSVAKIVRIG